MKTPKYITDFEKAAKLLVDLFCTKHSVDLDDMVNGDITDVLCFGDNFFTLSDIYYDLKNDIPKRLIFEWQYYVTEYCIVNDVQKHINFKSYCMGARFDM